MYEKGNQLVYELDQANRSLKLMKDNIFTLEAKIRAEVGSDFKNKLDHREMVLYKEMQRFGQFKTDLVTSVQAEFVNEQEQIKVQIRKNANQFKNLEADSPGKYKTKSRLPSAKKKKVEFEQPSNNGRLSKLKSLTS